MAAISLEHSDYAFGDIIVPADLYNALSLDNWTSCSDQQREFTIAELDDVLRATGRQLSRQRVRQCGPADDRLSVAFWRDEQNGLDLSLVCGGNFCPGYGVEQMETLRGVVDRLWYLDEDLDPEEYEEQEWKEMTTPPSEQLPLVQPFCSVTRVDVSQQDRIEIAPFLIGCAPINWTVPGVQKMLDKKTVRISKPYKGKPRRSDRAAPTFLLWSEVADLLQHFRWSLPGTQEFQWAVLGGRRTLFVWGDELNNALLRLQGNQESDLTLMDESEADAFLFVYRFQSLDCYAWPTINRFGLISPLSRSVWCLPSQVADDAHPLIQRGGAADGYPWQDCGEWLLLLTAVDCRFAVNASYGNQATIRPMIRFQRA